MDEIDALIESKQLQAAEDRFAEVFLPAPPSKERDRIARMIAEAGETDPTASRERQFTQSGALADLSLLVDALEKNQDWSRLAKYSLTYFEKLRNLPACRLHVRTLFEIDDFEGVISFLRAHEDLLARSPLLQSRLSWALFNIGDVNACRDTLSQLRTARDAAEDRVLVVNLAITSGDWLSLAGFVEQEWERRNERTAKELLRAGQIAQLLASTRSKALILEAPPKQLTTQTF